ncbi:MAG: NADH-quinone oxidoreductase subunit NuoK [Promethearchaeota archaeon]
MDYLILSVVLMGIGIYGLLSKYQFLKTVISIELITNAATMNFVLFASSILKPLGEAIFILAFSTDACISAIVLVLLVSISRKYGTCDIRELARLLHSENNDHETNNCEIIAKRE